jgi:hypothetical protein
MDQTTETALKIEGYVICNCCGAILGFKAKVGKELLFFVFAHPVKGIRQGLERRRTSARILNGDAYCSCCDTWQPWNAACDRPWEHYEPAIDAAM